MVDYALVLCPDDPSLALDPAQLETALAGVGLLDEPLSQPGRWFAAGEPLLELVTFLGCSPVVSLAAAGDNRFCRVHLPPPFPRPVCRTRQPRPRCPRCRTPDDHWQQALPAWEQDPLIPSWICPACGHSAPLHRLRFREEAGFGRTFVELWGIYPGEAVPGEELLETLSSLSTGPWSWFYLGPQ